MAIAVAAGVCRARLLSDLSGQTPCDKEATSSDGRLCAFHSRQCQALYRGYKKRNAELDAISEQPPPYLAGSKTSLVVHEFRDVSDEPTLRELHGYFFRKYVLLERVIKARKLHHSHFYAVDMDYGHEKYLTKLLNEKHVIAKALERLARRGADVVYEEREWHDWVKNCQQDEEDQRAKESEKVKLEGLLFKRHQRELQRQQREMKAKDDKEREEYYLQQVYEQRLSEMSEEEQDDWDPVQDVYGFERDNYVDLINFFLMVRDPNPEEETTGDAGPAPKNDAADPKPAGKPLSKSAKKRAKKANNETKKLDDTSKDTPEGKGSSTIEMETRSQMRERLQKPVRYERPSGWYYDADQGPVGVRASTYPLSDIEVDHLLEEIAEVKHFVFCRLLLSHASLLPIALRSDSIEAFLSNAEVTHEQLRDLCLKLERPKLQVVRDACADFVRAKEGEPEEEDDDDIEPEEEDDEPPESRFRPVPEKYRWFKERNRMPEKYQTKREKAAAKSAAKHELVHPLGEQEKDGVINFGKITDEKEYKRKRTRIKICGRYMYDYPSEKALNRGGWYHFSVIAKDSNMFDAVELCRNWNEFFELQILCLYHYFPAPKWTRFIGDLLRQQLLQLGFIPYFLSDKADKVTHYLQTGSRGMARRAHQVMEVRNFICGNIKRDDPVSRRFIQYLSMETWEIRALVRDRKTGRVLIQPPEKELWLIREKSGYGRASKNEFNVITEVGPQFFEEMDTVRQWHFGFEDYYDVYIWDASPGRKYHYLQQKLEETLAHAIRVKTVKDMFSVCASIFKTITMVPETNRVRSIAPGEDAPTMWDQLDKQATVLEYMPNESGPTDKTGLGEGYKYTEADEIEDAILFPGERGGEMKDNVFRANPTDIELFETKPVLDMRRFVHDLSSDDELSDEEEDGWYSDEEHAGDDLVAQEDDGNSEWGTNDEISEGSDDEHEYALGSENVPTVDIKDLDMAVEKLSNHFATTTIDAEFLHLDPEYHLRIMKNPSQAERLVPDSVRNDPFSFMSALRRSMRSQKDYTGDHEFMQDDFHRHFERQKQKIFKECWHNADTSPNARLKDFQWLMTINFMDAFIMSKLNPGPFELCKFMEMAPEFVRERRIVDDAFTAYASIALFYDTDAFMKDRKSDMIRENYMNMFDFELLDQAKRAKDLSHLDRRTHKSNKTMPRNFWADWNKLLRDNGRKEGDEVDDIYPLEWRKAIRLKVVKLFKAGVICTSYDDSAAGVATAKAEPGREMDLYIDYRPGIPPDDVVSHLVDPTPFDRAWILKTTAKWQADHPNARFSVLRLWSAPHFYPLMLGIDRRATVSFLDDRGRAWAFKFVPKDMPFSEWSIHQQLSLRFEPYRKMLPKRQVIVAKDLVLVMGKDAQECRRLSEGATWAVQTRPWRLEVDFWRSFVGVEGGFLEELEERWLE